MLYVLTQADFVAVTVRVELVTASPWPELWALSIFLRPQHTWWPWLYDAHLHSWPNGSTIKK